MTGLGPTITRANEQFKQRSYSDNAVAFASKLLSNERKIKTAEETITLGKKVTFIQKAYFIAMINHHCRTAYTLDHFPKIRQAVNRSKDKENAQPAA